jgi:hypothetical protein
MSKEHYSPSYFKQNTWEYEDMEEDEKETQIDLAYTTYCRVYLWDLDEPLPKEEFAKKLKEDENFRAVWGFNDRQ